MNANLAVIADNLDYLLWGRLAEGIPRRLALTLMMAVGAAALALPGGVFLAAAAWRYGGASVGCCFCGPKSFAHSADFRYFLALVSAADAHRQRSARRRDGDPGAGVFTAASVMHSVLAGLQSLPAGQYEAAADAGFFRRTGAAPDPAAAGAAQRTAFAGGIFIGLLKDTSLAFIVNVPELTTVAGQVNNRVQIYPLAIFVFTGAVYYLLLLRPEPAGKPPVFAGASGWKPA
ncbi:amino acid ABC transporter permease [Raoultella terrigena]|uniref:Amino acid ABC transporter permease n=1 Tax=Raoultella terrigena TaxID=577 RepID=A0A3P8JR13_RAOTE|nr:amino acid ABC transporter permease [Raoultella terrigena]